MKLKEFLTKWEWLDLEDADKTLTESEQKVWEIMQKNAQLEAEHKEHQEAMQKADKTIKDLEDWVEWYKVWYNNFKKQIKDLQTELETYRPTKLKGEGQCSCYGCKQKGKNGIYWTNWCYQYKGHIYCNDCLKEVLEQEKSKMQEE